MKTAGKTAVIMEEATYELHLSQGSWTIRNSNLK